MRWRSYSIRKITKNNHTILVFIENKNTKKPATIYSIFILIRNERISIGLSVIVRPSNVVCSLVAASLVHCNRSNAWDLNILPARVVSLASMI